jgi:hypothetical protein
VEFHVQTNASLLVVGAMLSHNIIRKSDQPVVYASRHLNKVDYNNNTTKKGFNNGFCFAQVQTLFVGQ